LGMIPIQALLPKPAKITLDWRAYFLTFCEKHGRNPIQYRGRLLFMDGWMYSATAYEGPEWPPPVLESESKALIREYWLRRKAIISAERSALAKEIRDLEVAQETHSAALQQIVIYYDPDIKKLRSRRGPLDIGVLRQRMILLEQDVLNCAEHLK
jgi:hypothetical protein